MRRQAFFNIGYHAFIDLLYALDGKTTLKLDGLPPGAKILAVRDDFERNALAVKIEADSLREVPDGDMLPRLELDIRIVRPTPMELCGFPVVVTDKPIACDYVLGDLDQLITRAVERQCP